MQPADHSIPLAAFIMRMVGFVVDHQQLPGALGDPLREIRLLLFLRRRLRAKHSGHRIRLIILRPVRALVKLLDITQEKHAFRVRPLTLAPHHAIEVPEDIEFFRTDRVLAEDSSGGEIGLQALQHDHVRRDQQKGLGVLFGNFILLRTALKYCHATTSAITLVFPLPVAILVQ